MSTFADLDEFLDPTLKLPVRGKTYVIESPDGETGIWCQRVLNAGMKVNQNQPISDESKMKLQFDDDEEVGIYGRVLGPVLDEMLADKVPWEYIKHSAMTALIWCAGDRDAAEVYWKTGGESPKAQPKRPQDRKRPAKSARPASTGTK